MQKAEPAGPQDATSRKELPARAATVLAVLLPNRDGDGAWMTFEGNGIDASASWMSSSFRPQIYRRSRSQRRFQRTVPHRVGHKNSTHRGERVQVAPPRWKVLGHAQGHTLWRAAYRCLIGSMSRKRRRVWADRRGYEAQSQARLRRIIHAHGGIMPEMSTGRSDKNGFRLTTKWMEALAWGTPDLLGRR
jgi:hypothetical protein